MIIISPLFYLGIKKLGIISLLPFGIFYILGFDTNIPGLSLSAILFFGLGSYWALNKHSILFNFESIHYKFIVFIGLILLIFSLLWNGAEIFIIVKRIFVVIGTFSMFYLGNCMSKRKDLTNLFVKYSETTLFIYLVHYIYILVSVKGVLSRVSFFDNNKWGSVLEFFLTGTFTVIIAVFLYYILKKLSPKILSVLLGNISFGSSKSKYA